MWLRPIADRLDPVLIEPTRAAVTAWVADHMARYKFVTVTADLVFISAYPHDSAWPHARMVSLHGYGPVAMLDGPIEETEETDAAEADGLDKSLEL